MERTEDITDEDWYKIKMAKSVKSSNIEFIPIKVSNFEESQI